MTVKVCLLVFITISLVVLVNNNTNAQNTLGINWQKSLGGTGFDRGTRILYTSDGNILVLAMTVSSQGDMPPLIGGGANLNITKYTREGVKLWSKNIGNTVGESPQVEPRGISETSDHGFIITGNINKHCFNTSPTNGPAETDVWVVKTDSEGNLQWEKCYGGTQPDYGQDIAQKPNGNYVMTGYVKSNDFDVSGNHGANDIWVAELNPAGDLLWSRCFGGSRDDVSYDLELTADGGFIITGNTFSFDGDFPRPGHTRIDAVIIKFSSSSTLEWFKTYGTPPWDDKLFGITQDTDGNYFAVGYAYEPHDNFTWNYGEDIWILKIDGSGSVLFQTYFGGDRDDRGYSIVLCKDNTLAVCGMTRSNNYESSSNYYEHLIFAGKFNKTTGEVIQQSYLGGEIFEEEAIDLVEDADGALYVLGTTRPGNPYVTGYNGGSHDAVLFKLGAFNKVKGTIFLDRNGNGSKETNEPLFTDGQIKIKKATDSIFIAANNGNFLEEVDTGQYNISFIPARPSYYTINPVSRQVSFTGYNNVDSAGYGVIPVPGKVDLSVSAWPVSNVTTGTNTSIKIYYRNAGTEAIAARIKFIKDARTDFISSTPAYNNATADTLNYTIPNLNPYEPGGYITITLRAKIPPALNVGDTLVHSVAIIHDLTDQAPGDNYQVITQHLLSSFEPDDKQEISMRGRMSTGQINRNEFLNYLVRFQNVENTTAFNIVIRDTLSSMLDVNSFEMVSSSHQYKLQVEKNNIVRWIFNGIKLPDSTSNEPGSHGYISFRIRPVKNLSPGDTIKNSASVYFDFNLPDKTNSASTIVKLSPSQPAVTGVQNSYCTNQGVQKVKITNPPVIASGITLNIKIDAATLSMQADSTFSFDVGILSAGAHTLTVLFANGFETTTYTYNFTINTVVTPDVNVNANITNVTNLTIPVTVTAINVAGGGTTPLYTFAKDRSFTNILQAEGSGNTLPVTPANLVIGDNWIYVRMKTSAPCYSAQTNADSINIRRDQSTGIIDLDNPNQPVNIYPNPFKKQITISGLNAGKAYAVSIYNLHGQLIYTKKIVNQSSISFSNWKGSTGIYWLTIYDEKRKRSMGSVKLIRE